MKFPKENTGKGVRITNTALSLSSLEGEALLELRAENGVVMLFKQHMTVSDLLKTVDSLSKTATGLIEKLTAACGECDGCDAECLFCQPEERGDIPEELAEVLEDRGICFDALYDLMDEEVVVYGG